MKLKTSYPRMKVRTSCPKMKVRKSCPRMMAMKKLKRRRTILVSGNEKRYIPEKIVIY